MTNLIEHPTALREAPGPLLAQALTQAREHTLALWEAYARALRDQHFQVPLHTQLNLPLWEFGHIAWFEEYWIARNPLRLQGVAADPSVARAPSRQVRADEMYNSSAVPHARRWRLDLPDDPRTRSYAARVREATLALLDRTADEDDALYFHRLALAHEDMHGEAWIYMAQHLRISLDGTGAALGPAALPDDPALETAWQRPAATFRLGHDGPGFAFDNELGAHDVELAAHAIDRAPVTWARYLPFIEAGGYDDRALWSDAGWAWKHSQPGTLPRHTWRGDDGAWLTRRFDREQPLGLHEPAMHLSLHEAEAWCRWAGRRLPTEAEWEAAALASAASAASADSGACEGCARAAFSWGQVWEWTASPFLPFPGFVAHPYRDYSQPWFDGRPVLRGGSFATSARLRDPRYRNYFTPDRNDLFVGFRTCAA
jgi:ergothioneine biosynthesis protein EgtB